MFKTIYIPLGSLNPVFLYLYILTFLYPDRKLPKKLNLLYIPFLLALTYIIVYKVYNVVSTIDKSTYDLFKVGQDVQSFSSFVYTIILIILSFVTVNKFEKRNTTYQPKKILIKVGWLKTTLTILLILTIFWGFVLAIYLSNKEYEVWFKLLWLGMSITIYWLGHAGIYRFGIISTRKEIRSKSKQYASKDGDRSKSHHIEAFEQLLKSEKKYRDPSITLEMVSSELGISKTHLSRIIHAELASSFTDYINNLRVEEVKSHLKNPDFSAYTLLAIGLEAGFNSKSSFNTVFKKHTGFTPSAFKKMHQSN